MNGAPWRPSPTTWAVLVSLAVVGNVAVNVEKEALGVAAVFLMLGLIAAGDILHVWRQWPEEQAFKREAELLLDGTDCSETANALLRLAALMRR